MNRFAWLVNNTRIRNANAPLCFRPRPRRSKLVSEKNKKTNRSCIIGSSTYLTFENSPPMDITISTLKIPQQGRSTWLHGVSWRKVSRLNWSSNNLLTISNTLAVVARRLHNVSFFLPSRLRCVYKAISSRVSEIIGCIQRTQRLSERSSNCLWLEWIFWSMINLDLEEYTNSSKHLLNRCIYRTHLLYLNRRNDKSSVQHKFNGLKICLLGVWFTFEDFF